VCTAQLYTDYESNKIADNKYHIDVVHAQGSGEHLNDFLVSDIVYEWLTCKEEATEIQCSRELKTY